MAREFTAGADIIILNQPTRGVDVGAMEFIHKKILEMRDEKKSLILVSADLAELKALSDRIIVFHQGTIAGVLDDVPNTTEEELGLYMLGPVSYTHLTSIPDFPSITRTKEREKRRKSHTASRKGYWPM